MRDRASDRKRVIKKRINNKITKLRIWNRKRQIEESVIQARERERERRSEGGGRGRGREKERESKSRGCNSNLLLCIRTPHGVYVISPSLYA